MISAYVIITDPDVCVYILYIYKVKSVCLSVCVYVTYRRPNGEAHEPDFFAWTWTLCIRRTWPTLKLFLIDTNIVFINI